MIHLLPQTNIMKNFVEELRWRGMIHDMMPGSEELLKQETVTGYIGFDPTSDSLHIGSLVQIMILVHFQNAGHQPIALVGGATGMVGDPSGKSKERNLLTEDIINKNLEAVKKQLSKFLDFEKKDNPAEILNNYDWLKDFSFLEFIRDVGKHITINYMTSKDSVKSRLETGLSFTEFTYQLVQGYDFYHLYNEKNCKLQLGGSDQWGNITTGTELIRRKCGGEAFAITSPLLKRADGTKFGKTSDGENIWLDPEKTSPYKFYQYWFNSSDEDAKSYIRIFTLLNEETIEELEKQHEEAPHQRILQKEIAKDITIRVHGENAYNIAIKASQLLFGKSSKEDLFSIPTKDLLSVFDGVPQATISKQELQEGLSIIDSLSAKTAFLNSNGEARRALKENAVSVNKEKVKENYTLTTEDAINEKLIVLQKGKKNYYLINISSH